MTLRLLAVLALCACQTGGMTREATIAAVPATVSVSWVDCGGYNGAWVPGEIVLCNENKDAGPGFAKFVFLHELGHEMAWRYGAESPDGNEASADAFATIVCVALGHEDYALATAGVFETIANDTAWHAGDEHPPLAERAAAIRCLVAGAEGNPACQPSWNRAVTFWYDTISASASKSGQSHPTNQ